MTTGQAIISDEVRTLIRQRSLDPADAPGQFRQLVNDVIADYQDRSLMSPLPRLGDPELVAAAVFDEVAGLGPLQPLLDDPTIEEIWINEPGRVFVARRGISELTTVILSSEQVSELVERMLRSSGRRLDISTPFVDAQLPGGSRLHVAIPPITQRHMAINIRKFVLGVTGLGELVRLAALTESAAQFLRTAVAAGLNILVAGGTQAGKTTLLNALCGAIPASQRVITVEEVFELRIPLPDVVGLQTRQPNLDGAGEVTMRRLVKEALRMRPNRIVVGEVRQEECLDLLIALNSGLPGMCTLHANSAREALLKMCTLPLLAGENVTASFVVPTVAAAIDIVVHVNSEPGGRRAVREILGVTGRAESDVIETSEIFSRTDNGALRWAGGFPPHERRFDALGVDLARLLPGDQHERRGGRGRDEATG